MTNILPIAAIVAICLFVAKETLEYLRRVKERRRKTNAIKELLQNEIAENHRALNSLFFAIHDSSRITSADETDTIIQQHGARLYYQITDSHGNVVSGMRLLAVSTSEFARLLPALAELDRKLYRRIRDGYQHIFEIEHLLSSFVDFIMGRAEDRKMWFESFCEYAERSYDDIDKGLRNLYRTLANRDLPTKSLSYLPTTINPPPKV